MKVRYCLGTECRELTPLTGQQEVCDRCFGAKYRARHRAESKRHMAKPDKRAKKLAANRRWWATVGKARRASRKAQEAA